MGWGGGRVGEGSRAQSSPAMSPWHESVGKLAPCLAQLPTHRRRACRPPPLRWWPSCRRSGRCRRPLQTRPSESRCLQVRHASVRRRAAAAAGPVAKDNGQRVLKRACAAAHSAPLASGKKRATLTSLHELLQGEAVVLELFVQPGHQPLHVAGLWSVGRGEWRQAGEPGVCECRLVGSRARQGRAGQGGARHSGARRGATGQQACGQSTHRCRQLLGVTVVAWH